MQVQRVAITVCDLSVGTFSLNQVSQGHSLLTAHQLQRWVKTETPIKQRHWHEERRVEAHQGSYFPEDTS